MSPHHEGLNDVLLKAITTVGDYAIGTRLGRVVRFQKAEMDGAEWLHLRAREGTAVESNIAPWLVQALVRNGVIIRIDEIMWAADLG